MHFLHLFPRMLKKFKNLSIRQFRYEIKANVWVICLLYAIVGVCLVAIAYWVDMELSLGGAVPHFFQADYELTRQIVSSLVAGIITLNAFTLNSILVVLTNFSGQFTPRMLTTFISDKRTQHVMGIFNLVFVFILFSFFLLDQQVTNYYFAIPTMTVLFMLTAVAAFIYFVNHSVNWMQVPNIMFNMKCESKNQILETLGKDLEPFRTREPNGSPNDLCNKEAITVCAAKSGYIQIVNYKSLVRYAQKNDLIIRFEKRIGEFVLEGTPLMTYWERGSNHANVERLRQWVYIGAKKTEVQDLEFGINKLKEIAIKSIGNDDPDTASNAIFQLTDLLLSISKVTRFTPYLTDQKNDLRVIIKKETFEFYLYSTFSHITIYAQDDPVITNDVLEAVCLLVESIDSSYYQISWEFALMVAKGYRAPFTFNYTRSHFLDSLEKIANTTGNQEGYQSFLEEVKQQAEADSGS